MYVRRVITLFTIQVIFLTVAQPPTKLPLWSWDCIDDKCVPSKATMNGKLQSLMTCNMLCSSMQLWPQPTGAVSLATTAVPVRADLFKLKIMSFTSKPVRDYLRKAFTLFRRELRTNERNIRAFEDWRSVIVRIVINENGSTDPRMLINTDESYQLRLYPKLGSAEIFLVDIFSHSFCGARHAMETLSQLIWLDPYAGSLLMIEAATVDDAPRFRYRGLLLDTARNYFPVNDIIKTIDAMAASKLNTFHWHATDSQAFSLLFDSVPQLAKYGAYGHSTIYSSADVRAVVNRARLRGIRVLIEVDLPAHVGSAWDWGQQMDVKELAYCIASEPWVAYCQEPPCGQINPRNDHVYDLIERIYTEIINLTGVDDMFHIGGDDISERCWLDNFDDTDPVVLWSHFTQNILKRLEAVNGQLPNLTILWSSQFSERMKTDLKSFVHKLGLQVRSVAWSPRYVSGIRTIVSHEDVWDLNNGYGTWHGDTEGPPYNSWQRIYEHRPWARKPISCMEGGEATVWSSTLSTGCLDAQIWPRAAALAERLWSDRAEAATRLVHARLDVHRSRLVERGIRAAPMWSMWCTHNTNTC
ncbi:probable beta-hexosaminidase fdl isoform X1 [Danaus plexippus]|uniref:probable beta-hexosaminidase fdl isoform X1 n=1 Tax=Danaus plexippus TaxID=13037 RepID=UPI002AB03C2E|nr:probable beta-hexosaminidase fdl isoform X1 [Danaus plexippus]